MLINKINPDMFRIIDSATICPEKSPCTFVRNEDYQDFYNKLISSEEWFIDIKIINNKLKDIIISTKERLGFIVDYAKLNEEGKKILNELLSMPTIKVFKESKPILKMFIINGIKIEGPFYDCYIADTIISSGFEIADSFDQVQLKYLNIKYKSYSNWAYKPTEYHINDAVRDAVDVFMIKEKLDKELKKSGLMETVELEFACLPVMAMLELNGVQFDVEKYRKLVNSLAIEKDKLEAQLTDYLGNIDLNNTFQVLTAFKNLGSDIQSLSPEELTESSRESYPYIGTYSEYKKMQNLLNKYNDTFLKYINNETGRVNPTYKQNCSSTGRIYCTNPNLQQLPREKEFRELIIAKEGYKLVITDYSQIELHIAAEISNDQAMIEAFKKGIDIHRFTASIINNKKPINVTDEERHAAKAINFGLIYGMGNNGLVQYAQSSYGVQLTLNQAAIFRNRFFRIFKDIRVWQDQMLRNFKNETRTLGGRKRLWNKNPRETEVYNSPIQGTGADILKRALSKLYVELQNYDANIVLIVHDEIIVEASKAIAEQIKSIVVKCMVEAGQAYLHNVPVEVKATVGDSWADK